VNKIDITSDGGDDSLCRAQTLFADYEASYPVHYISARTGTGLAGLRKALDGKLTDLAGPSGAGKSSLLNALDPEIDRQIQQISVATGKGRHTTTTAEIFRIDAGTFVADTPGMRSLAMSGIASDDLDRFFPELRPYLGQCFYADCQHLSEPGCRVIEALDSGEISRERYASYAALRRGDSE
ncbi:MAG: ribosome small subunit-dependent GTPase A, partial [Thermomicrobiales bacterium]